MLLHGPGGGLTALQCVPAPSNRPLGRGCRCAEAELGLWSRALQPAVGSGQSTPGHRSGHNTGQWSQCSVPSYSEAADN